MREGESTAKSSESVWAKMGERANLQSIGEFVRNGADIGGKERNSFKEREEMAYRTLTEFLNRSMDEETAEEALTKIENYTSACEDIYFSLGMKAGAQVVIQLTGNYETDY